MNWSDTPPTKAGDYYIRIRDESPRVANFDGTTWSYPVWTDSQFGPRIPTADEIAELPGLVELYACKRMNQAEAEATDEWGDRATFENQASEYKAKINAILGVADETDGQ